MTLTKAPNYTTLLFDLDDTLLDFNASENKSLELIHTNFFSSTNLNHFKETYKGINKNLWNLVNEEKATPTDVKRERFNQLADKLQLSFDIENISYHYENMLGEYICWFAGAKELLLSLKEQYKIGIVTNGLTHVQEKKYHVCGFHELCECFLISEKIGVSKPNPLIFEQALKTLNANPHESLMIGDSLQSDFRGALNAGIDFCWINHHDAPIPATFPKPKYVCKTVSFLSEILLCNT